MPAVFKTYLTIDETRTPAVWTSTGTVVEVEGAAFVRSASGTLLTPLDETWSATASDAKRFAAARLDAAAARISAKAAELRSEADATT